MPVIPPVPAPVLPDLIQETTLLSDYEVLTAKGVLRVREEEVNMVDPTCRQVRSSAMSYHLSAPWLTKTLAEEYRRYLFNATKIKAWMVPK